MSKKRIKNKRRKSNGSKNGKEVAFVSYTNVYKQADIKFAKDMLDYKEVQEFFNQYTDKEIKIKQYKYMEPSSGCDHWVSVPAFYSVVEGEEDVVVVLFPASFSDDGERFVIPAKGEKLTDAIWVYDTLEVECDEDDWGDYTLIDGMDNDWYYTSNNKRLLEEFIRIIGGEIKKEKVEGYGCLDNYIYNLIIIGIDDIDIIERILISETEEEISVNELAGIFLELFTYYMVAIDRAFKQEAKIKPERRNEVLIKIRNICFDAFKEFFGTEQDENEKMQMEEKVQAIWEERFNEYNQLEDGEIFYHFFDCIGDVTGFDFERDGCLANTIEEICNETLQIRFDTTMFWEDLISNFNNDVNN